MAFTNLNKDSSFSTVGIFWQDAAANTAVFYFLNQGVMMRFLSVKSVNEGKKALLATVAILMPIAAIVVASGGWIGSAMQSSGMIAPDVDPKRIFFVVSDIIAMPGVFGLVMAALTAALMSTVDTLITAVAAVCVNDVYRPYIKPAQTDSHYLRVARYTSIGATLIGIGLVPVFDSFGSIYSAHGAFTAAVTPPLVVAPYLLFYGPGLRRKQRWRPLPVDLGSSIVHFLPRSRCPVLPRHSKNDRRWHPLRRCKGLQIHESILRYKRVTCAWRSCHLIHET